MIHYNLNKEPSKVEPCTDGCQHILQLQTKEIFQSCKEKHDSNNIPEIYWETKTHRWYLNLSRLKYDWRAHKNLFRVELPAGPFPSEVEALHYQGGLSPN